MTVVYFAEKACHPGLIKIGFTGQPRKRASVGGFTILATIPGGPAREAALHWAHRADRAHGEWFHASPAVLDTLRDCREGDLGWLEPEPPFTRNSDLGPRLLTEAKGFFGTRAATAAALGYRHPSSLNDAAQHSPPPVLWGRMAIIRASLQRRLPPHLSHQVHVATQERTA